MAGLGDLLESARTAAASAIADYGAALRQASGPELGEALVSTRAMKDQLEAIRRRLGTF
jgi:hypothetical protein